MCQEGAAIIWRSCEQGVKRAAVSAEVTYCIDIYLIHLTIDTFYFTCTSVLHFITSNSSHGHKDETRSVEQPLNTPVESLTSMFTFNQELIGCSRDRSVWEDTVNRFAITWLSFSFRLFRVVQSELRFGVIVNMEVRSQRFLLFLLGGTGNLIPG